MKPRNFPARKLERQQKAGQTISDAQIATARGQRSKKTPRENWSPDRSLRRRGRVA